MSKWPIGQGFLIWRTLDKAGNSPVISDNSYTHMWWSNLLDKSSFAESFVQFIWLGSEHGCFYQTLEYKHVQSMPVLDVHVHTQESVQTSPCGTLRICWKSEFKANTRSDHPIPTTKLLMAILFPQAQGEQTLWPLPAIFFMFELRAKIPMIVIWWILMWWRLSQIFRRAIPNMAR